MGDPNWFSKFPLAVAGSGTGGFPIRILVAEVDSNSGVSPKVILMQEGHQVLGPAGTVKGALALAAGTRPDLAVVDCSLNGDDDGFVLAQMLSDRNIPALLLCEGHAAREVGLGYIAVPWTASVFAACIRAVEQLLKGENSSKVPAALRLNRRVVS